MYFTMINLSLPWHIFFISYDLNSCVLGYIKKSKRKLHLPATASVRKFLLSRMPLDQALVVVLLMSEFQLMSWKHYRRFPDPFEALHNIDTWSHTLRHQKEFDTMLNLVFHYWNNCSPWCWKWGCCRSSWCSKESLLTNSKEFTGKCVSM